MKKFFLSFALVGLFGLAMASPAHAQMEICFGNTPSGVRGCIPVSVANPLPVGTNPLPTGATAAAGNAVGSTGILNASLPAVPNQTNYLCGFTYQGSNPNAAANVVIGVTGIGSLAGGFAYPTNANGTTPPQPAPLVVTFSPCLPANAPNTAIAFGSSALGLGAPIASLSVWGYSK